MLVFSFSTFILKNFWFKNHFILNRNKMPVCKNKFWLENYSDLFCEIDIIPLTRMSLARQLNALSRLIFLITLIIAPLTGLQSIYFFIAGIVFIIILFYSLRNMDCKENYQPCAFNNRTAIASQNKIQDNQCHRFPNLKRSGKHRF